MKRKVTLLLFTLLFGSPFYAQLTTSTAMTPTQLVNNVLLGGGITATNVTFTGYANAIGSFSVTGTNNLGMTSGVVMTTGTVLQNDPTYGSNLGPQGPNNMPGAGADNLQPGDPYLTSIAGTSTHNAAILEFDFVPQSDTIKFNYVFGTEEYMEWVTGGYADVFAFVVTGVSVPHGPYNVALIPGTTTPVTALNVNLNNNSAYYVDNGDGMGTGTAPDGPTVQYDGFTVVLTATDTVTCGQTYHIKLMIADAIDGAVDAGVFLQAGSFSSPVPVSISSDVQFSSNDTVLYEGCGSADIIFTRPSALSTSADTFSFVISGTAVNGTDYTMLNDTIIFPAGQDSLIIPITAINDGAIEGIESIVLTLSQQINVCGAMQTIVFTIYVQDLLPLNLSTQDTALCNGNSVTLVPNLTGGGGTINYTWTASGSTVGNTPTITVSPTVTTNYIVTVTDSCGQGPVTDTITVQVNSSNYISASVNVINDPVDTVMVEGCDSMVITFTRGGLSLGVAETFYYTVGGTATNGTDYTMIADSVTFPSGGTTQTISITAPNDGVTEGNETLIITIPPDTSNPCALQVPQVIVVYFTELSPIVATASDDTICAGGSTVITATSTGGGGLISYNWNQGVGSGATHTVSPAATTNYIVTVTDNCGSNPATDTATVTVLTGTPSIQPINDMTVCQGDPASLPTIITGGNSPYVIAWAELLPTPDSVIILSGTMSSIPAVNVGGIFIVNVADMCMQTDADTVIVTVDDCALNIPNIVTPNGDGINDQLYFRNLEKYPNSSLAVYNRWGTKVFESTNYNNAWVPDVIDGVYYFILTVSDNRNFSGYFHVLKHK